MGPRVPRLKPKDRGTCLLLYLEWFCGIQEKDEPIQIELEGLCTLPMFCQHGPSSLLHFIYPSPEVHPHNVPSTFRQRKPGSILQSLSDILFLKFGVGFQDFLCCHTIDNLFQEDQNGYPHASDSRLTKTDFRINRNSV